MVATVELTHSLDNDYYNRTEVECPIEFALTRLRVLRILLNPSYEGGSDSSLSGSESWVEALQKGNMFSRKKKRIR